MHKDDSIREYEVVDTVAELGRLGQERGLLLVALGAVTKYQCWQIMRSRLSSWFGSAHAVVLGSYVYYSTAMLVCVVSGVCDARYEEFLMASAKESNHCSVKAQTRILAPSTTLNSFRRS
jgi:hypothetical protein